jgi:protein gp37
MADVFEDRPDLQAPRARLWELIAATPALTWMLLTKRPQHVAAMVPWAPGGWPAHVWLGVTAEDQATADARIPVLLGLGARTRFLSCEPLTGPLDLAPYLTGPPAAVCTLTRGRGGLARGDRRAVAAFGQYLRRAAGGPGIDWVITGGESGPKAVPTHPDWVRRIRDLALDRGVAFFHKQWGEHDAHGVRVGRKTAGALLDGVLWRQIPASLPATGRGDQSTQEELSCSTRTP